MIEGGCSEVDVVPAEQISINRYMLCNLDLNFVKDEELDFRVDFVLKPERKTGEDSGRPTTNRGGGTTTVQ